MIARIEGTLREKAPTRVVVDVGGVGYELLVSLSTYTALPDESKTVALRVHTHVREDALLLFGFHSERERVVFELLIRISGVGPKLAQAILSGIAPEALVEAVRAGDVAALRAVPGVGPKTAERIVVELRDRVLELAQGPESAAGRGRPGAGPGDPRVDQTVSALVNLGTPRGRAERAAEEAVQELGEGGALEALVRAALRRLAR
jgi:Holliday junction DNA helicase RuvA